ncbi:MAG: class I SAM-dependent methyltransferase [Ruminococcus flavefaciens]|nr:class I SAM-dependent methyltransferase [Ruminococcus flavefaciens]
MTKVISSVSYRQEEIIKNILTLYAPNGIDADITYSIGNFYKSGEAPPPKWKSDIQPQSDDVVKADSRKLPLADGSLGCVMFDPPFLVTKGASLATDEGNIIVRRFGCFSTERELYSYYTDSLKEIKRVLKPDGIAIVKCQDKVSSGRQYVSHNYILNAAADLGLYCEDIFILLAKTRIISSKHGNQKHARKYHAYFLVFRKNGGYAERVRRDMYG